MKRLLVVLLSLLLLLSACTNNKTLTRNKETIDNNNVNRIVDGENLSGKDFINLLKNYTVRYKTSENVDDNEEFDSFLDDIFVETMEDDYLNMHYTLIDYKAYGVEKPELTIGEVEYSDDPDISDLLDQIYRLQAFDFDSLSYRQQYDYEILEYSLIESLASTMYSKYDQLFTGGTDILSNLVTNFDEFVFHNQEEVEDYLVLLSDTDRYVNDAYVYTSKQAQNGLYLTDYSLDYTLDYINSYCSKVDDNTLITSFNDRIDSVNFLDDNQKNEYKEKNEKIVKEEIIPVFEKGVDELSQYYGHASVETNRLSNIDKDYAELVYLLNTSNNMSIDEIFENAKDLFDEHLAAFNTAYYNQKSVNEFQNLASGNVEPLGKSNEEILEFLANNYMKNYPNIGEIKYNISYLDESSASDSIIAYYMPSPLDDLNQNVIRMNPNLVSEDPINTYQTLAHEGIPGHLYEHVHFYLTNPANFRITQSFIGYTEGYACYSQNNALDYITNDQGVKDLAYVFEFGGYVLQSIIDMGVNYFGWTVDDAAEFMNESGFNGAYAENIVEDCIDRAGVLDRYGIGCLSFETLRAYAIEKLGDSFDEIKFNEAITKNGPMPFSILKEAVNEYIYE